jgi:nucleotidyltransferase substrate binding protein (TIGR01987 family)
MARLEERLSDAQAALTTLEELVGRDTLSTAERDGAILRLVYTFEAVWKAAALLLEQKEGIAVGSPKGAIRASRRAKLLGDADAEDAVRIADDRNLTVHMYKQDLGEAIAERLAGHAAVLRRWLDALQQQAAATP